jgi:cell division transport system permease protein
MKIETFQRHVREAYRGIMKNYWMSLAAMGTVAVTLLIFGIFLCFAFNISYLTKELDREMAVRAILQDGLDKSKVNELIAKIEQDPMVASAEFVPKEKGLQEVEAQWGDAEFIKGLKESNQNPLPDIILVKPKSGEKAVELEAKLKQIDPAIIDADAGGVVGQMISFGGVFRNVIFFFGLGLAILAAFLISNTIRLTIFARSREIEIMRLVGASNWFIRWPYFIEGAILGIVGAIFPTGLLLILYQLGYDMMNEGTGYKILKIMPVSELAVYLSISIFLLGAFIGVVGSIFSVRRFLKV